MNRRRPRHATTFAGVVVTLVAALSTMVAMAASASDADLRTASQHAAGAATTRAPATGLPTTDSATGADAAKGPSLALPRHVIAGGGGSSSGGAFAVSGTIGQADADPLHPATGGVFAVTGGFWPGIAPGAPPGDPIFANGFEPLPP